MLKRIGIMTSGGDAPGMNAAIRAAVKNALSKNIEVSFIYDGYLGIYEGRIKNNIQKSDVGDIINRGGSILGCSRFPMLKNDPNCKKIIAKKIKDNNIDALVVIGGDGSFTGAHKLREFGIKFIGIPGTIDNDINGTDETIGFDTCLNTIVAATDNIRDTSSSHHRCIIIEVMGRSCGDLAIYSGISSGCDIIITPGTDVNYEEIYKTVKRRKELKKSHTLLTFTENITDIFELAKLIEKNTGVVTRATRLGFIQRGGRPSFRDRYLGTIFGYKSIELLSNNITNVFIGIKDNELVYYDVEDINRLKNKSSSYLLSINKVIS